MLHIQEIRKNPDGLVFEKKLDLAEELKERNPEILDVQDIVASGKVQYEDGLYFLDYDLSSLILPVSLSNELTMSECCSTNSAFIDGTRQEIKRAFDLSYSNETVMEDDG